MSADKTCRSGFEEPAAVPDHLDPHAAARAWRMRAVHVCDTDRQVCGLCLSVWPCPTRNWADHTLYPSPML